tara:strand:+ start:31 stop:636 length:606 start_codon:yes stop_codon:yes gene_type:complete
MNNWNTKKEDLLKKWNFESSLYIWLHNYNAEYYKKIDNLLSIPSIIISAITSTTIFSTINNDNRELMIIVGCLLIIGTFLQSARDYFNINRLIYDNIQCSKDYQIIYNDIEEQLNQEFNERDNAIRFINKIKIKRNNIILNSPDINSSSWKKLKNNIEKGELVRMEHSDYFLKMINNQEEDITLDNIKKKLHFHNNELLII